MLQQVDDNLFLPTVIFIRKSHPIHITYVEIKCITEKVAALRTTIRKPGIIHRISKAADNFNGILITATALKRILKFYHFIQQFDINKPWDFHTIAKSAAPGQVVFGKKVYDAGFPCNRMMSIMLDANRNLKIISSNFLIY